LSKNKKIGVITWHYYGNFGSMLQAYSLCETLKNFGDVKIINYKNPKKVRLENGISRFLKFLMANTIGLFIKRFRYRFLCFEIQYFAETKLLSTKTQLENEARRFDCIICGSDQIWAPNVFNPIYMLNFTDSATVKKVSYAASIGLNDIPDNLVCEYSHLLSDFVAISVRENEGAELLKRKCNIKNVSVVLDPTLLICKESYRKIEKKVKVLNEHTNEYIFCYFLNSNHNYEARVKEYASRNGLKLVGWSANYNDKSWLGDYHWIGPCEFLWLVDHAKTVITDSYHGTIFSLIFGKNFFTFERFKQDDPINQNSRLNQLNIFFNIKNRIIASDSSLMDSKFDYCKFEKDLAKLRNESIDYLRKAVVQI